MGQTGWAFVKHQIENWRDLLVEFILGSTVFDEVEKTKENIDNNNDLTNEKDLNAPGPTVLDNDKISEESKGLDELSSKSGMRLTLETASFADQN